MSEPKVYPAGMSGERFKELTTPFTLTRFGKSFPIPAKYTPDELMKALAERQANGELFEPPDEIRLAGLGVCGKAWATRPHQNNPVASNDAGK